MFDFSKNGDEGGFPSRASGLGGAVDGLSPQASLFGGEATGDVRTVLDRGGDSGNADDRTIDHDDKETSEAAARDLCDAFARVVGEGDGDSRRAPGNFLEFGVQNVVPGQDWGRVHMELVASEQDRCIEFIVRRFTCEVKMKFDGGDILIR